MLARIDPVRIPRLELLGSRAIATALWRSVTTRSADPLRYLAAEAAFFSGEFDLALSHFERVSHDSFLRSRSRLMQDWIRFHRDDFSVGWPRYPGTEYVEPGCEAKTEPTHTVRVTDPRRPSELATRLGMRRWTGNDVLEGPLVIWFNFRDSIGGEILASRLIRSFQKVYSRPLILACGPRLVRLFTETFKECEVLDNSGQLDSLAGRSLRYVLVRDLLGLLIKCPGDFAVPAAERLRVPPVSLVNLPRNSNRPQVAISWKTTNDYQGRYRNAPLIKLSRVLAKYDCDWHVAQHGHIADELAVLRRHLSKGHLHTDTLHPSADIATFAGELAALDAVVTIDNSLLHLAGGLGLDTLGLLTVPAYWAWPAEGSGSRWYSEVKLIRQRAPGDWGSVFAELDLALGQRFLRSAAGP